MAPSHLTLAQRKAVAPRLHFFEANQKGKTPFDFEKAKLLREYQHLWLTLNYHVGSAFSDPPQPSDSPDKMPLDDFLHSVQAQFSSSLGSLLQTGNQLTQALASEVASRLASLSCATCAGGSLICDGRDDDPIVANGGHCISPLKTIFTWAIDVARVYYRQYSPLFRRVQLPSTYLSTGHSRFERSEYFVSGTTFYHDRSGGPRVSEIKLLLSANELDFGSYLAVPYVFFHEVVCHAFSYIALKDLRRQVPEPDDSFTEGWMDFLCLQILTEFLNGKGPAAPLLNHVFFSWDYIEHANTMHTKKCTPDFRDITHPLRDSHVRVRTAVGNRAARKVLYFLQRLSPSDEIARKEFFELSLGLNLHYFSGRGISYFAQQLDSLLDEPGIPPSPDQLELAARLFSNYLKHKDIRELYDSVIHIDIHLTND
jgi:hypothetical protein